MIRIHGLRKGLIWFGLVMGGDGSDVIYLVFYCTVLDWILGDWIGLDYISCLVNGEGEVEVKGYPIGEVNML